MFKAIITTLVAFLLVVGAVAAIPFFIPPSSYHATIEQLISDNLGREVRIRELHYQILPLPHITGSNITIIAPAGGGEAAISKIDVWLSLRALAHQRVEIKRVHFAGLASNQHFIEGFLKQKPGNASTSGAAATGPASVSIERISASSLTFRTRDNHFLGPFEFDARLGGPHGFERIEVAMDDGSAAVTVQPVGQGFDIQVAARDWTVPLGPRIRVEQLQASALLVGDTLQVSSLLMRAYGGTLEGNANVAWPKGAMSVDARLSVHGLPIERVAKLVHAEYVHGNADGIIQLAARGNNWTTLLNQAQIVGDVSIRNGYIGIPGPIFAFDQLAGQVTLTATDVHLTALQARANGAELEADNVYVRWQGSPVVRGSVKSTPMPLEVVLAPFVHDNPLRANVGGELSFELAGNTWHDVLDAPDISGRLAFSDVVLNNPGIANLPVAPGLPWLEIEHLETDLDFKPGELQLKKLRTNGFKGTANVPRLLISWRDGWTIAGQISVETVSLEDLLGHLLNDNRVSGTLSGQGDLKLTGPTPADLAENAYFSGAVAVTHGRVHAQPIAETSDGHRHHSAPAAKGKPLLFYFDAARAEGTLESNQIALSALSVQGYGGEFTSNQALLAWREGWQASGLFKVAGVQIEPLIHPFVEERILSGDVDAELDVKLKNAELSALLAKPAILGKFVVNNGVVYKADLEKAGKGIVGEKTAGGQTRFDRLSGDLFLKNGKLRISEVQITSPSLAAHGRIKVDRDNRLDGSLTVGMRGSGGLLSVPLNIAGTVDKPSYTLTGGAMLGGALGTSVLGPGLGTLVGVQTGKVLSAIGSLFTHNKEEIEREQAEDMVDEQDASTAPAEATPSPQL